MAAAMSPIREYGRGLSNYHAWTLLAWDDVRNRYKRTVLGPLWVTLAHGLQVTGIALAFSLIFKRPLGDYFVYLAAGITVWNFVSGSINEGPSIFLRSRNLLFSYDLPASIHIFRFVTGQIITFAHQMLVFFAALLIFSGTVNLYMLWAIPALAVLAFVATGWSTVLAFLGARFRDVAPAVGAVTHMSFMLTPIFWERAHVEAQALWFVLLNPFYHLIEILRAPLLGRPPDPLNWAATIAIGLVAVGIGLFLYGNKRSSLSFWL